MATLAGTIITAVVELNPLHHMETSAEKHDVEQVKPN
jgi:hypothetical protein